MKFAENNRISQRQLYRQIVIAFIAPLILCLFGNKKNSGAWRAGRDCSSPCSCAVLCDFPHPSSLCFCQALQNSRCGVGTADSVVFLIYCIFGAAFLLNLLGEIVAVSLGTGIGKNGYV